jgi:putative RecB family exonuclease
MRYSYSKIAAFRECPLKFKYAYIDNIKPAIPNSMLRGNFMHLILENIGKEITYERLEYVLKNISRPVELPEREVQSAISSIDKWFNLERFRDVVAVEKVFSIRLGTFELTGRIDRIDRLYDKTFAIIDYKSGYFNSYNGLQLQIYALVGYRLYDADEVIVKYEYIDRNETSAHSIQREQSEEFSKILIEYMSEIENSIQSNYFPPSLGPECKRCVFNDICSAYNKKENKHE